MNDKAVVKVGRFYPSSKTCSVCGWKNDSLILSDRSWTCPQCGTKHERDVNAAVNILGEGLHVLSQKSSAGKVIIKLQGQRHPRGQTYRAHTNLEPTLYFSA